jgi:hypothetical protein
LLHNKKRGTAKRSKVKVKLSLCSINSASRYENIWGSGGIAPSFLISALDGGKWSASRFTHGLTTDPDTHWTRGGPQSWSGREEWNPRKAALASVSSIYKRQTGPLVREGAPQKQDCNYQIVINIWS